MTEEYRKALTELEIILKYGNIQNLNKLPTKLTNFIKNNKDNTYNPDFDKNIPIYQLNLKKDTKILLSLLYRKYWCNEETKLKLLREDYEKKENI